MLVLLVNAHVKPEFVEAFREASLFNASHSVQEPGVVRFDVLQQQEDPTRFVLVEVYKSPEDHARHRETAHYKRWRDLVAEYMAEPRVAIRYDVLYYTGDGDVG